MTEVVHLIEVDDGRSGGTSSSAPNLSVGTTDGRNDRRVDVTLANGGPSSP